MGAVHLPVPDYPENMVRNPLAFAVVIIVIAVLLGAFVHPWLFLIALIALLAL